MAYEFIRYELKDHVAHLTLNRPHRLNAVHPPMQLELWDALINFRNDPDAWVVILSGEGERAFCAGNDLKWSTENPNEPVPWPANYVSNPHKPGPVGSLPTEI